VTGAGLPTRRLFFACWPTPAVRAMLCRETGARVRHCGGLPVAPADLHLTLAFLGQVDDAQQAALVAAARRLAVPDFSLALDRYGWFEAAQVLWLGCREVPAALARLAGELAGQARAAGLQPDPRPFRPHVTLARKVRNPPDLAPPRMLTWPVGDFALVESLAAPAGLRYRLCRRFPDSG